MSGAQHTPGPWHWVGTRLKPVDEGQSPVIGTILDDSGAMVYREASHVKHAVDECEANRRLIAAAPDLLEALELLMADGRIGGLDGARARAAIAKATGGAA